MRHRLQTCLVFLAALSTVRGAAGSEAEAVPNVLLIISDDQAWTDYGFMGHPHVRTPRLDRLAEESLTFTRGYVPASLCSPSLATILTGLYPHQHRVTSNDPPLPAGKGGRAAQTDPKFLAQRREMIANFEAVPTLPRLLADQGYMSFQSGKWWGGNFRTGGFTHGMTHGETNRGGRHGDEGLQIGRQGMQPIEEFLDTAEAEGKPFFLWYAPFLPHSPHNPPERLLAHYRDVAPSLEVAKYWAMCEWLDETCDTLLASLDERGLAENTIVVYVTDNGWIQDPDADRFAPRSKQSPYDGGLRTPIMIRWPGKIEPTRSMELAGSIDLAPTILAALKLPVTPEMRGINLLDETAVENRNHLFGDCYTHNAIDIDEPASSLRFRWVIEGDWKLIVPAPWNEPEGVVELFNLLEDPLETRNLAHEMPERVSALARELDAWWNPGAPDDAGE